MSCPLGTESVEMALLYIIWLLSPQSTSTVKLSKSIIFPFTGTPFARYMVICSCFFLISSRKNPEGLLFDLSFLPLPFLFLLRTSILSISWSTSNFYESSQRWVADIQQKIIVFFLCFLRANVHFFRYVGFKLFYGFCIKICTFCCFCHYTFGVGSSRPSAMVESFVLNPKNLTW